MITRCEMMENTLKNLLALADNGTLNAQTLEIVIQAARNCFDSDAPMFTRHDMPRSLWAVLNTMIEVNMIDAASVYEMSAQHGMNWKALTDEIAEIADANRHSDPNGRRAVLLKLEAWWIEAADIERKAAEARVQAAIEKQPVMQAWNPAGREIWPGEAGY